MKIKDGAKVFIKNEKLGKYLFFLRDDKPTIPFPNTYGLLGGGIEEGEQPLDALRRELIEETNIEVFDIKELGSMNVTVTIYNGKDSQSKIIRGFLFLAKTEASLDDAELYEGQRLDYFSIEEALKQVNLSQPVRDYINNFREKLI
ncbi:MAG: NUDIX domain-containing protein [Candidatus Moranbacteria bacterium]|nr:NUDIX domain-containing protein [Candidatus Moranbacteria bacterium]